MRYQIIGACLLVLAGALWGVSKIPAPYPSPSPSPTVEIPELVSIEIDARDRQVWAGLLEGLGRFVAADAESSSPIISTAFDVETLRTHAVSAPLRAVSGGPEIGKILAPYLDAITAGVEGELSDKQRREISDVFINAGETLAQ